MSRLDAVLLDLEAEGDEVDGLVAGLTAEQWRAATPAAGWDVAAQIAHLAWADDAATVAAVDPATFEERVRPSVRTPDGGVDAQAVAGAAVPQAELLARWRAGRSALAAALRAEPDAKLPWFGPSMSTTSMATARLMETWAHSVDIYDALGRRKPATDRVRHIAFIGTITRGFAFVTNDLEPPAEDVHVVLTLPSGAIWEHGPAGSVNSVRGSAYDFALRVTQRRHRDDLDLVATGPVADQWLDIAQAFAGRPGAGRPAQHPAQHPARNPAQHPAQNPTSRPTCEPEETTA